MSTYAATARREGRYWLVTVDGVGVTQARSLREARIMAHDLAVAVRQVDPASVEVHLTVELPHGLGAAVKAARRRHAEADSAQREAAAQMRETVAALRAKAGLSGQDLSEVLGVSPQRVSQLAPARAAKMPARATVAARTPAPRKNKRAASHPVGS